MEPIKFYRSSGENGYLSNLYKCTVSFDGRVFRSAEDAYQFGKPKDAAVAEWLMDAPKPHLTAVAAHALLPWDIDPRWGKTKVGRMARVIHAKFQQNTELREKLLATGSRIIMENSKTDRFWGIGKDGKGKNMLGIILMDIRTHFKNVR